MRKFSLLLAAILLISTGTLFANEENKKPKKTLTEQIGILLDDNKFIVNENDLTAEVLFTINSKQEIVVISVDTEDGSLEKFVKSRLNYKKVELQNQPAGRMYTVPVRITS